MIRSPLNALTSLSSLTHDSLCIEYITEGGPDGKARGRKMGWSQVQNNRGETDIFHNGVFLSFSTYLLWYYHLSHDFFLLDRHITFASQSNESEQDGKELGRIPLDSSTWVCSSGFYPYFEGCNVTLTLIFRSVPAGICTTREGQSTTYIWSFECTRW